MLLLTSVLVPLLASLCSAEYYYIFDEDFLDFIGDSKFHVEPYENVSSYGIPSPASGRHNSAVYLTDVTSVTQTPYAYIEASGALHFTFRYFCDGSASQLEIQMSYPTVHENIVLCGPDAIENPGEWIEESFYRECYSDNCDHLDIWLFGQSISAGDIVGLYSLGITTDVPTTTNIPITTQPACYSPGSNCASGHGTCRIDSCDTNEHEVDDITCGGSNCKCCKLSWPSGGYGLPAVRADPHCPDSGSVVWSDGWVQQDTESHNGHNDNYMFTTVGTHYIQKHFCMKTSSSTGSVDWPAGDYCIYRDGGVCPSGFNDGWIEWEDRNNNGPNTWGGERPDGTWDDDHTRIDYCCREDGSTSTPITLPTQDPFILIANQANCQKVYGMSSPISQSLKYDTEDFDDDSKTKGDHPYICTEHDGCFTQSNPTNTAFSNPETHYCYYE